MTKATTILTFLLISLINSVSYGAEIKKTICSSGCDYTSLSACMDANEQDLTDNGGDYFLAEITEGFQDTTAVVIDGGWVTSADNYIRIYTTPTARHDGKWDDSAYILTRTNDGSPMHIKEDYVTLEGLQITTNDSIGAGWNDGIVFDTLTQNANEVKIDSSIIKSGLASSGAGIEVGATLNYINLKVFNTVIYGFDEYGIVAKGAIAIDTNKIYVYNSTIASNGNGIRSVWGALTTVKNSAVFDNTDDFDEPFFEISYCASDDGDGTDAVDWDNEATDWANAFVDYANGDFHVKPDSVLKDAGTDLSSEGFTDDIQGQSRNWGSAGGAWDIGADENVGVGVRIKGKVRIKGGVKIGAY